MTTFIKVILQLPCRREVVVKVVATPLALVSEEIDEAVKVSHVGSGIKR